MDGNKKLFFIATIMFGLTLGVVFLVYDLAISGVSTPCDTCPSTGGGGGIDPATVFWQVFSIVAVMTFLLVLVIKWKENKRVKENVDSFRKIMRSRR